MMHKIIALLQDGNTHSGVELGSALGVTRSAVGKQISKLKEMGFQINCIKGSGYRLLIPFEQLDAQKITRHFVDAPAGFSPPVDVVWSTTSTNDYVMSAIRDGRITESGFVCLAEYQSAGRGRRGKSWVSPLGGGLCLSFAWRFERGAESLEGLSLSVAIAVVEVLENDFLIKNLKIKWPNDIFLDDKKLGGILIDVMGEAGGPCWVVVGVGLNVRNTQSVMYTVDQPWVDLYSGAGAVVPRNILAAKIITKIAKKIIAHERDGFSITNKEWSKYDAFFEKKVVVKMSESDIFYGVSRGISTSGGLIVDVDGVQKTIKSGEVSLRRA